MRQGNQLGFTSQGFKVGAGLDNNTVAKVSTPQTFDEWCKTVPRCIGYAGGCDGYLAGTLHEENCPMYNVDDSAGMSFGASYRDAFLAGQRSTAYKKLEP